MFDFNMTSNLHSYLAIFVPKTLLVVWYFIMDLIPSKFCSYFALFESKSIVIFICCLIIFFKLHKFTWTLHSVVATTRRNGTCDMLTSVKLSVGYLVVGITRELNKELSLHCSSIYINTMWSVLQQYLPALMFIHHPHVLLLIHMCFS